jgi:hypothetical protein
MAQPNLQAVAVGGCIACGRGKRFQDPLLPVGTEDAGHAWLHSSCREAWHADRRAKAFAALADVGIIHPGRLVTAEE